MVQHVSKRAPAWLLKAGQSGIVRRRSYSTARFMSMRSAVVILYIAFWSIPPSCSIRKPAGRPIFKISCEIKIRLTSSPSLSLRTECGWNPPCQFKAVLWVVLMHHPSRDTSSSWTNIIIQVDLFSPFFRSR